MANQTENGRTMEVMNTPCQEALRSVMPELWKRCIRHVITEARTFAKVKQFDEINYVQKIAKELSCMPKIRSSPHRVVILTQGHNPVIVAKDGKIKEYPVPQLRPEQIIDSTGAGDAFVGGFLAQFVLGAPLEECISCGIWCASQMIQQQGCSLEGLVKYSPKATTVK